MTATRPRTRLEHTLDLEQVERDLFRGVSPKTHLQRNFGGQVAAQALVAATRTVDPAHVAHSLHAYFVRPGSPDLPTVYLVDRVRDGRSFVTRRVTGVQDGKEIFTLSASFHVQTDTGPQHCVDAPQVPQPEDVAEPREQDADFQALQRAEWPDWDLRRIPLDLDPAHPRQRVWLRHTAALPDDPLFHLCALTYASDMTLLGCATAPASARGEHLQGASLDHAVWLLRPFRADDWLLYDQQSPSAGSGRGLSTGQIYDRSGSLVAHVVQEGLVRYLTR